MLTRAAVAAVALGAMFAHASIAQAHVHLPTLDELVTDGPVESMASTPRDVYVGGGFTYVGRRTGPGVVLSARRGRVLPPTTPWKGIVTDAVADGRGGFFVAGAFGHEGSGAPRVVTRVLADGTVDRTFRAVLRGHASALALAGGRLYVAGKFYRPGSDPMGTGVVALDAASGRIDPGFAARLLVYLGPTPTGIPGWLPVAAPCSRPPPMYFAATRHAVAGLVAAGGRLWIGGRFAGVNGKAAAGLAAVSLTTGEVEELPATSGGSGVVTALDSANGRLFVARSGSVRPRVVAIDAASGIHDPGFAAPGDDVTSLAATPQRLYVGREVGGSPRLLALDAATGREEHGFAARWVRGAGDLALDRGRLHVAGIFSGGRRGVAALDAATGARTSRLQLSDRPVWALASAGRRIFAGGDFESLGGLSRRGLVAFDAGTRRLRPGFHVAGAREVAGLEPSRGRLFASGRFVDSSGDTRTLVALDPRTGSTLPRFRPPASAAGGWTLARIGETIYAAPRYGGRLNAFDAGSGRQLRHFGPPLRHVWAVATDDSRLYAVGANPVGGAVVMGLGPRTGQPLWRYPSRRRSRRGHHVRGGVSAVHGRVYVSSSTRPSPLHGAPYRVRALDPTTGRSDPRFHGPRHVLYRAQPLGSRVVTVGSGTSRAMSVFDARTGAVDRRFEHDLAAEACAALVLDDRLFVGGRLWERRDYVADDVLVRSFSPLFLAAFDRRGHRLGG